MNLNYTIDMMILNSICFYLLRLTFMNSSVRADEAKKINAFNLASVERNYVK